MRFIAAPFLLAFVALSAQAQEATLAPHAAPLPHPSPLPREPSPEPAVKDEPAAEKAGNTVFDEVFSAFAPSAAQKAAATPIPPPDNNANRARFLPFLRKEAEEAGVPADLADAVASTESNYDPSKRGPIDEIGLMQITPAMARRLGHDGKSEDLFEPELNMRLGVRHLAASWRQAGQDVCHTLMKYRFGLQSLDLTDESKNYCRKTLVYLASIDSNLGRAIEMPGLVRPDVTVKRERFDWQDHEGRMKAIEKKWGGENFGIIAQ